MTDLRSYIAGLGSSGALVAAVVVAFLTMGGIVAIKGKPQRSTMANDGAVLVEADARGEAKDAGATSEGRDQRAEAGAGRSRDGNGSSGNGGDAGAATPPGSGPQPVQPPPGPTFPPGLTPPAPQPPAPNPQPPDPPDPKPPTPPAAQPPKPPQAVPPPRPVGGLIEGAEDAAGDVVGFEPGVAAPIAPITDPVDGVIGEITKPIPLPSAPDPAAAGDQPG